MNLPPPEPGEEVAHLATPFAVLRIKVMGDALTAIDFLPLDAVPLSPPRGLAARRVAAEVNAYLHDPTHHFGLRLAPAGTPFQQKVWNALTGIAAGRTISYGELAGMLASSPRAVGQACARNPIPVVIPCHRVLGGKGLGGFMGSAAASPIKRWLLEHERGSDR
jgi:methylated-DNA-[protein]-cysteine S-methyltransferase